jgi:hypothetical protein
MKLVFATFFLSLFLLCCTACNDDEQPTLVCENGLEVINDSCQCPANKFLIGNTCRELNENEYWAIMPVGYPCRDTLFIEFSSIDTVAELVDIKLTVLTGNAIVPVNNYVGSIHYEINTTGGKFNTASSEAPFCKINDINTGTTWEGEFINDTEVHIKMYHRNMINWYDIIDSTEVTFTR